MQSQGQRCSAIGTSLAHVTHVLKTVLALLCVGGAVGLVNGFQTAQRIVRSSDELQAAIDTARPGQTIWLSSGATYVGHFRLPPWRGGVDTRPIVIRTVGTDLAKPGERMTPQGAERLAKLRSPDDAPALATSPGTRFWRIELVELLANRTGDHNIITLGADGSGQRQVDNVPSDLVLDRLYIHGDPVFGQKRAIALNSARTTISNSYIADIKSVGMDSQAIAGWNGPGDYVIENNYLEAAGENVLFGGSDPAIQGLVPTSIVIRGNTISKPIAWRQSAIKWQVKNLLELKNARKVTIENNVFERNWAAAQSGYAILFTVRNQDGGCPWCAVEDVRFARNVVRDVAAGISILGQDDRLPSLTSRRLVISGNLFIGLDGRKWGGDGYLLQMLNSPREVVVDHNTVIQGDSSGIAKIDGPVFGFELTNNVTGHGAYGIIASSRAPGNDSIRSTLPGAVIVSNVIAGGNPDWYPPGNFFPSVAEFRRQFVDFDKGDFRLRPSSSWLRASTTGGPVGSDLVPERSTN